MVILAVLDAVDKDRTVFIPFGSTYMFFKNPHNVKFTAVCILGEVDDLSFGALSIGGA